MPTSCCITGDGFPVMWRGAAERWGSQPTCDAPARRVVRAHFKANAIALGQADPMHVQATASLREDGPAMAAEDVLDGVEAAATALRHDAFEHEEISIAR